MAGKPTNQLTYAEAKILRDNYSCSHCWRFPQINVIDFKKNIYEVVCPNCGSGVGFVSNYYVETRRASDFPDYWEAYQNLKDVLGLEDPAKKEEVVHGS